jgi:hypothetical protein
LTAAEPPNDLRTNKIYGGDEMLKYWRALALLAAALCGMLGQAYTANADAWPPKTIRIIVPFPPGGTTDVIARRVQPLLERNLKTTILIENRGGASGSIGTQVAVTSPPDGGTFVLVFDTHGANPSLLPNLPFDTVKDLAPIMLIGTSPMVITAHPSTAYKSWQCAQRQDDACPLQGRRAADDGCDRRTCAGGDRFGRVVLAAGQGRRAAAARRDLGQTSRANVRRTDGQ